MFKHYFELVENVAVFPIIAIIIFFTFFVGVTLWAFIIRKGYVEEMSNLPLEDSLGQGNDVPLKS